MAEKLITDLEEFDTFVETLTEEEWAEIDKQVDKGMRQSFVAK